MTTSSMLLFLPTYDHAANHSSSRVPVHPYYKSRQDFSSFHVENLGEDENRTRPRLR